MKTNGVVRLGQDRAFAGAVTLTTSSLWSIRQAVRPLTQKHGPAPAPRCRSWLCFILRFLIDKSDKIRLSLQIFNTVLELQLRKLGAVPFGREVLSPLLAAYKRPNDKITEWLAQGVLVAPRRGLYVVGPAWRQGDLSLPLLANRLYGPSCVSLDSALSLHGLIPERVHALTSVCLPRGRVLDTPLGRFAYTRLPGALYPLGICQQTVASDVVY